MKRKSEEIKQISLIPGQVSIFDLVMTKPPEVTKTEVLVTEKPIFNTNKSNLNTEFQEIIPEQQKIIDKYKQNSRLNRIIYYCGRGIGIELNDEEGFKTIYVNSKGEEEFSFSKRASVIYLDKVIYDKTQTSQELDPAAYQKVKIGDFVEAEHGKKIIQGEIVHAYGLNNWILNIVFDNGKKHTAIGRQAVRRILKVS